MASHSFHPDTHEFGLADGCPRCDEHSEHPAATLDKRNIEALLDRIENNLEPRSGNEAVAMARLRLSLVKGGLDG